MKIPSPGRPARRSVTEVARDLSVKVKDVRQVLRDLGEYVDSDRKKCLEEPVVRRIFARFGKQYAAERPNSVSGWQRTDQGGPARPKQSRPAHQPPRQGPWTAVPDDASAGLGDPRSDAAPAWADQEWKLYGFTEPEADAWMAEGLRRGQAKVARDLRDAGLTPSNLGEEVFNWTVAKRLRGGESPAEVLRLLHRSRGDKAAGA